MSWSKHCIVSETSITPRISASTNANLPVHEVAAIQTNGATVWINNDKLYVSVVTLSTDDNITFLENIKQGFERTISWNKYRSKITIQIKNNNSDYLIDPSFNSLVPGVY